MSKIYEVKTEENWFIGKWEGYGAIHGVGISNDENYFKIARTLDPLYSNDEDSYDVVVIKKNSDFALMSFIVDMINQEKGRQIEIRQHQGAVLFTEGDKLLVVHLPDGGVSSQDFFGDSGGTGFGDTILIATRNEGKTKEFRKMFGKLGITVENLNDYPDLPEVAETGMTFEENARLKAEIISALTGKMVLSDDSGLKVDVLGGLPGVWSARFSGPDATDDLNNAKLLHELAMVFDKENRSAQFHTCLVVAAPNKESLVVEADWEGYIGTELKGDNGFGYDPLFIVGEGTKTAAELSADEKNEISHRGLAMKKLMEVFPKWQATH
ncbi:XTP/dITP diphosphohydrolase [Streptococcus saliviloxodontae]|uniref:dITP/XTP pyrophosphatase n=2 Tax=Streptococcus saliviloxodontae TaxID=1349416 RepID=A0ABS2PJM0_9STRE|nr:nucleoside-triphosphate diphosphatase [Streptococcus saliviloxodontae]MBM7635617.1 XTP/dITP diphosphohydrolase [Streptococcus saliviloxodontae]